MMMRGKVGAFSYYVSETRQIVRQAQNNSNFGATATRAPKQQTRRVKWANLVNFYSGNKGWMKKAFENLKPGVSIFNAFMSANMATGTVALTKAQAKTKMCVLQPFVVSQGSFESITYGTYSNEGLSNINWDPETEFADVTVGGYSQSIIKANSSFQNGDAVVAIAFGGTEVLPTAALSAVSPASYRYFEFVLDVNDTTLMEDKYPQWLVREDRVTCAGLRNANAYAYIHTRTSGGKLIVSTERMILSSGAENAVKAWSAQVQVDEASDSYTVDTPVMLAPGGTTSGESGTDNNPGSGGSTGGDDDGNLGE